MQIEISMAQNKPFMAEDKEMIQAFLDAGFAVDYDYMWIISVNSDEEIKKAKIIFESFPIHKNKNFRIIK
jgi:hypothetical protein